MIASLLLFGANTSGGEERSETLRRRVSAKNARPVAGLGGRQPPAAVLRDQATRCGTRRSSQRKARTISPVMHI